MQKGAVPAPLGSSARSKKVSKKPTMKPSHPKYKEMIALALKDLKKPKGASRQAISNYISTKYTGGSTSNHHLRTALKSMVQDESIMITKGIGASGSYRINKEAARPTKPAANKAGKPKKATSSRKVAKKSKSATGKKSTAGIKKRIAKAGVKKQTKTKTALKAKKTKGTKQGRKK